MRLCNGERACARLIQNYFARRRKFPLAKKIKTHIIRLPYFLILTDSGAP